MGHTFLGPIYITSLVIEHFEHLFLFGLKTLRTVIDIEAYLIYKYYLSVCPRRQITDFTYSEKKEKILPDGENNTWLKNSCWHSLSTRYC